MQIKPEEKNPFWKRAPIFKLLLPLVLGIITVKYFPIQKEYMILVYILSLLLIIFSNTLSLPGLFGLEWVAGAAIQFSLFSVGMMLFFIHQDIPVAESGRFEKNSPNVMMLEILNDPAPKHHSYKCLARIKCLIRGEKCYYENEKILVYFQSRPDSTQFTAGSLVLIWKQLQSIENFENSGFDYKRYCRLRHIYSQVFLKRNEFTLVDKEEGNTDFSNLYNLRKKILLTIRNGVARKSESSLLEALLIGFTDDMEPGLLKSYADAGVIHIIAISGLHLALIYHILQLISTRIRRKNGGRWIKFIAIVFCLWCYSLISGASPSVTRAALMFSISFFGHTIVRQPDFYNTLAASAFLLLCFDPYWLWDTGFQLSYTAVLSLSLFTKPIQILLPLQNKILLALWKLASVSIAAQVLTTPLCIFYFQRFPTYFLISNLLAVPLSSGILLGGFLLCIFYWIHPAGFLLGMLLSQMIHFLNVFIQYISRLPGSVIPVRIVNLPELILIYVILFCFYRFLILKKRTWLLWGLGAISLFQVIHFMF